MANHEGIFLLELDQVEGHAQIEVLSDSLCAWGEIKSCSAIYKTISAHPQLYWAFRYHFEGPPQIFNAHIKKILSETPKIITSSKRELNCLCLSDGIALWEEEPLPSLMLTENKFALRCAAEAWPDFHHPILQKNLSELARERLDDQAMEVFTFWKRKDKMDLDKL